MYPLLFPSTVTERVEASSGNSVETFRVSDPVEDTSDIYRVVLLCSLRLAQGTVHCLLCV